MMRQTSSHTGLNDRNTPLPTIVGKDFELSVPVVSGGPLLNVHCQNHLVQGAKYFAPGFAPLRLPLVSIVAPFLVSPILYLGSY